ncbi:MAG: putative integral membrane protein (TIGR00698 family) [Saprospiraceae bacterium]|jgi:uncharacterized integral membrane protein (TIGR00698 family)
MDFQQSAKQAWFLYYPGIFVAFVIAASATFLSEHYGAPVMLFALLIGIAFHFLTEAPKCEPGIDFAAKRLLKIGIALLGVRITFEDLSSLGTGPVLAVLGLIVLIIGIGVVISKLFGRGLRFGLLTGSAVAICGASAALAVSSVLRQDDQLERDVLFTVIAVTILSTIAMIVYPVIFKVFGFDDISSGALIGATIHDVAQVVGAGYSISPEAGDTATYIKLLRVASLPIVVLIFASFNRQNKGAPFTSVFPWFALGFAFTLTLNSLGFIPEWLQELLDHSSRWLLVASISALGVKTSLKTMTDLGPLHFGVIIIETLILLGLAILAWTYLI